MTPSNKMMEGIKPDDKASIDAKMVILRYKHIPFYFRTSTLTHVKTQNAQFTISYLFKISIIHALPAKQF